jgi:translocation and assembly module TamB
VQGTLRNAAHGSVLALDFAVPRDGRGLPGLSEASAGLSLPLLFRNGGMPEISRQAPLAGSLRWEGDIAPLWNFLPLADRSLSGQGSVDLRLAGTPAAPLLAGRAEVKNARYADMLLGVLFQDIQCVLTLSGGGAGSGDARPPDPAAAGKAAFVLTAGDGMGGTVELHGEMDFLRRRIAAEGILIDLKPLRRPDLRFRVSGRGAVNGSFRSPVVTADLTVSRGELNLGNLSGGSIRTLPLSGEDQPAPPRPRRGGRGGQGGMVAATINVPGQFFVRGNGLNCEWRGSVFVNGPFTSPFIVGTLDAVRGNLDFLGKNFTLNRGRIMLNGLNPANPMLDILMEYMASNITANVTVNGTANRPRLELDSQPARPQDEILSQILFGESARRLNPLQAVQLASAAAALAGVGGGADFLDLGRKFLGVDVLRVNTADGPRPEDDGEWASSTLEMGKYVTDKIYVGVEQGLNADSTGAVVEVELTPDVQVDVRANSRRTDVGVRWRHDY